MSGGQFNANTKTVNIFNSCKFTGYGFCVITTATLAPSYETNQLPNTILRQQIITQIQTHFVQWLIFHPRPEARRVSSSDESAIKFLTNIKPTSVNTEGALPILNPVHAMGYRDALWLDWAIP